MAVDGASRRHARDRTWHAWVAWTVLFAAVVIVVRRPWKETAVPPAANHEFSAERAFAHIDALATRIGRRVVGSEAYLRSADYVEAELRALGVATERQVGNGTARLGDRIYVYRDVINVLARLPGERTQAVLVSAHYDSRAEGPGAGDNALGVAVALEVVRALRAGGALKGTVIFNFNGGEELGLLGAAAFTKHPWFADVASFINLDASGAQGRQLLFQVTAGRPDLVEAYSTSAPHVHGTVFAQEVFGLMPFDTDYHVYRDAGLGGLDLAPYSDNYAYHTALDRAERVSKRTLQESGENVLAILRGVVARAPAPDDAGASSTTYYDLLGVVMVRYSGGTAFVVGMVVAALVIVLAWRPRRGPKRSAAALVLGTASIALSALFALVVPVAVAIAVTLAGQVMSWYARPWIAVVVYGTFTGVGVLAGQSLLRWFARRGGLAGEAAVDGVQRGLAVFWAMSLVLTTASGLGSAYLPLWWCVGSAAALLASTYLHGVVRWSVTLAGAAMAVLTTAQAADLLLTSIVPLTGLLDKGAPVEVLVAATTAFVLAPLALALAPAMQAAPLRRVGGVLAVAVVVAVGLVLCSFPYTAARPKRVYVEVHAGGASGTRLAFETIDPGPFAAMPDVALEVTRPLPTIEVRPSGPADVAGSSAVEVSVVATGAYLVEVQLQGAARAWSLSDRANGSLVRWVGTGEPLRFRVDKLPGEPVVVRVKAFYPGSEVSLEHVLVRLPDWTVPAVRTVLEASAKL